jgi:3',5'-cyclic-AMP phosphodiesterase
MFNYRSIKPIVWTGLIPILVFFVFLTQLCIVDAFGGEKDYYHLVVLADPHLPGVEVHAKEKVIKTINSWDDVDAVAVLGDICHEFGVPAEYAYAKKFFSQLTKPTYFITGNHDYFYDDFRDSRGRLTRAFSANQEKKLNIFKETFSQPELYYSKTVWNYLLVFLSVDELGSSDLTRISEGQLDWLRSELTRHKSLPTIVFCHAPLKGTLQNYNKYANTPNFVVQPEGKIRELILQNPQVFLWVSGHTHTPPTNESYASEINLYEKQVTNIHTCDMNRGTIYTNSIYLYPDKVAVRTFNHKRGTWIHNLERTIIPPVTQP